VQYKRSGCRFLSSRRFFPSIIFLSGRDEPLSLPRLPHAQTLKFVLNGLLMVPEKRGDERVDPGCFGSMQQAERVT
jgi:hypothetical protein